MELSTMPMLAVSCSRKEICSGVNDEIDANSITALTWFSNSTGNTMTFFGTTLNSEEPIGTAVGRHIGNQKSLLVDGTLADQPWPVRNAGRIANLRVVGVSGEQLQRAFLRHLIDHAELAR
jgi:hypothetical protein